VLDDAAIRDAVTGGARSAVLVSAERVNRAMTVNDVEQVIGSAKDLVECVAKIVIEAVGVLTRQTTIFPILLRRH